MLYKVQDVRALQINTEKKQQVFNSTTQQNYASGSEISDKNTLTKRETVKRYSIAPFKKKRHSSVLKPFTLLQSTDTLVTFQICS